MTTINSIHDLHKILVEHPEWREELRKLLLTEELLALPQRFAEYTKVTDNRLDRIENDIVEIKSDVKTLKDDMGELKGVSLENKLHNRGIALTATHLQMYDGERMRVAERDDNSAEFNAAMYAALSDGTISNSEYTRLIDTDMIVRGRKISGDSTVYAAIEATYSISRRDIDKVCRSANLIRRLFPDSDAHPLLYYITPNASLEREAAERGVTLMMTQTLA
ncbi:MAG: hypothetical protein OXH22_12060 [Chloroflexi bacterium]|nr:hypothetical protein [Chloroflexota bacterium]